MSTANIALTPSPTVIHDPLSIHISRVIRAPRSRVFEAWLDPEQMRHWQGVIGWNVIEAASDPYTGGAYQVTLRGSASPGPGLPPEELTGSFRGTYLEIISNELIRSTWIADWAPGEETSVTIRFSDVEGGTLVELTHDRFATELSATNHGKGWTDSISRLAAYLERQA